MGVANIKIVHIFDNGYLEEEKSMILSFTVSFGAKDLRGMVTSVSPNETFSLTKKIFFVSLKSSKITSKIQFLRYVTFRSRWSCDIQFHKYAVHINGDF